MLSHRILAILSFVFIHGTRAGNNTCLNNSMDWFTQSVGETPCRVNERLRGLCSPGFQVGNMGYIPPGDKCGDQVGKALHRYSQGTFGIDNRRGMLLQYCGICASMLCMSCQYGIGSGENGDYGFDAPQSLGGTYGQFLNDCGRPTNQSLPTTVQKAVCNAKIKIPSYVYTPSWQTTGEWYFYYTRQTAQLQINSGDNETSTRCNEVFATAQCRVECTCKGIAFGGVALLFLGAVAGFFLSKRFAWWGRNRGMVDLVEGHDKYGVVYEPYRCTTSATQLITTAPILHNAQGDSEWTYTGSS
ncbi:unnamed protein product [Rhizoctonia solani]|uniref:Uncharacterized protein n=1 Tax=Rhizoctonia solani TaxID=456999 RepID=A0A8H3I0M6_9AGAM|nr:unnamed protein product [Rhizoctonia solani]